MTSKEADGKKLSAFLISPVTISIFSDKPFSATLRLAISALSSCISSPVKCEAFVFASNSMGIIPVPVPKSSTFPPDFTVTKPDNRTASIPKQNLSGF